MKKKAGVVILVSILVLAGAFWGVKTYLQKKAADEIRIMVDNARAVTEVTYSGLSVNPLSMKANMEDVTISLAGGNGRIDITRIELNKWAIKGDIPTRADICLSGIHATPDGSSKASPAGDWYKRMAGADIRLAYHTDPDAKLLSIENLAIRAPELGELHVRCRLGNVDLEKMTTATDTPFFLVLVLPGISVSTVDIDYRDEGLVQQLVGGAAARNGMSRDDYVARLEQQLLALKEDGSSVYLDDALTAFIRFLNDPQQIQIKAAPSKPVPFGQFLFSRDRGLLFEMLKIQVVSGDRVPSF